MSEGNWANGDLRTDFAYDGLGRLREREEFIPASGGSGESLTVLPDQWSVASDTRYIYDGWRVIQERDSNNTATVSYTRGNDLSVSLEGAGGIGGLLARSGGSNAYYYADGNGNITSMIDTNQTVVASYRYDPFGNIISKSGTLADANVYRFSSKEEHITSGMYYYGFRFYDPNLQRWVNRDPIEEAGGVNLYRHARNNPIMLVDSQGLRDCGYPNTARDPMGLGPLYSQKIPLGSSPVDYFLGGAAVGGLAAAAVVAAAPAGVSALVLAGMSETAASGTVTAGLAVMSGIGATATGYGIYNDARAGNWNGVAFDFGTLTGGAVCAVGGGGRALAQLSGKPSSVPPGAGLFGDSHLGYDPSFPGGNLAAWLGSAPTPQSGGVALTTLAGGTGMVVSTVSSSGGGSVNSAQQFENNYRSLPGKWQ